MMKARRRADHDRGRARPRAHHDRGDHGLVGQLQQEHHGEDAEKRPDVHGAIRTADELLSAKASPTRMRSKLLRHVGRIAAHDRMRVVERLDLVGEGGVVDKGR